MTASLTGPPAPMRPSPTPSNQSPRQPLMHGTQFGPNLPERKLGGSRLRNHHKIDTLKKMFIIQTKQLPHATLEAIAFHGTPNLPADRQPKPPCRPTATNGQGHRHEMLPLDPCAVAQDTPEIRPGQDSFLTPKRIGHPYRMTGPCFVVTAAAKRHRPF